MVGGGGGLSFGSEVGCGGVVSTDEPSSVETNGVGVTGGVGSINVEDRIVGIGSAVGRYLVCYYSKLYTIIELLDNVSYLFPM